MPLLETMPCPDCRGTATFEVTDDQIKRHKTGAELIQQIFPELSPSARERLMTGLCPDCWAKIFSAEER